MSLLPPSPAIDNIEFTRIKQRTDSALSDSVCQLYALPCREYMEDNIGTCSYIHVLPRNFPDTIHALPSCQSQEYRGFVGVLHQMSNIYV